MENFIEFGTAERGQENDIDPTLPICVLNAGHFYIDSFDYPTSRPQGRADYQIIYVVTGSMKTTINGVEKIVSAGNLVIYKPNEPQIYTYLCKKPCEVYWIHFYGTMLNKMFNELNINNSSIISVGSNNKLILYFDEILTTLISQTLEQQYFCSGNLMLLLSEIAHENSKTNQQQKNMIQKKFRDILLLMNDTKTKFSLEEFARLSNMSVSRFSHLFKETYNVSPYSYYLNIRINRAKLLLSDTTLSVSEIANKLGYEDTFAFSRIFKKHTGISPKNFRLMEKSNKNGY